MGLGAALIPVLGKRSYSRLTIWCNDVVAHYVTQLVVNGDGMV